jgi:hypothetical protein
MEPKALEDWVTSPRSIWPLNSRGAWMTSGSGLMIWLIDKFQPVSAMVRFTKRR